MMMQMRFFQKGEKVVARCAPFGREGGNKLRGRRGLRKKSRCVWGGWVGGGGRSELVGGMGGKNVQKGK